MKQQVASLAFKGDWGRLLPLLRANPDFVNSASATKGYSPLHQAAWHGASAAVVGELLALGANCQQLTANTRQTPHGIAAKKRPKRADLQYLLLPPRRTLGQLMRKAATAADFFGPYDGNQTILDQLASAFLSVPCPARQEDAEARTAAAFFAATGVSLESEQGAEFAHKFGGGAHFDLPANLSFWRSRFLPAICSLVPQAHVIPLAEEWATVADLFDPAPEWSSRSWGLRGDLFLWIEMRQALCHVALPCSPGALLETLSKAFTSLTGAELTRGGQFPVARFARGGMSSGFVSCDFWTQDLIPTLQLRLQWLCESWAWKKP